MEEPILYHEEKILPLLNVKYNLLIAASMDRMLAHIEDMYEGVMLTGNPEATSYTCIVNDGFSGRNCFVLINKDKIKEDSTTLIHEAVNISWYALDCIGLTLNEKTKVIQGYLCEEIYKEIQNFLDENDSTKLGSL